MLSNLFAHAIGATLLIVGSIAAIVSTVIVLKGQSNWWKNLDRDQAIKAALCSLALSLALTGFVQTVASQNSLHDVHIALGFAGAIIGGLLLCLMFTWRHHPNSMRVNMAGGLLLGIPLACLMGSTMAFTLFFVLAVNVIIQGVAENKIFATRKAKSTVA